MPDNLFSQSAYQLRAILCLPLLDQTVCKQPARISALYCVMNLTGQKLSMTITLHMWRKERWPPQQVDSFLNDLNMIWYRILIIVIAWWSHLLFLAIPSRCTVTNFPHAGSNHTDEGSIFFNYLFVIHVVLQKTWTFSRPLNKKTQEVGLQAQCVNQGIATALPTVICEQSIPLKCQFFTRFWQGRGQNQICTN